MASCFTTTALIVCLLVTWIGTVSSQNIDTSYATVLFRELNATAFAEGRVSQPGPDYLPAPLLTLADQVKLSYAIRMAGQSAANSVEEEASGKSTTPVASSLVERLDDTRNEYFTFDGQQYKVHLVEANEGFATGYGNSVWNSIARQLQAAWDGQSVSGYAQAGAAEYDEWTVYYELDGYQQNQQHFWPNRGNDQVIVQSVYSSYAIINRLRNRKYYKFAIRSTATAAAIMHIWVNFQ